VPAQANRCPQCWADLDESVTDVCPFCRRNIANQVWDTGGPKTTVSAAAPDAVTAAMPAAPAGGGAGVAVAERERDRIEFPGTPLPAGFFDALPEKTRHRPPIPARAVVVLGLVAVGAVSGISGAVNRHRAVSSPARPLIADACAEYRDITGRMHKDQDVLAAQEGIRWFQTNGDRFAEAARLDPALGPAAEVVAWFNGVIDARFGPLVGMSKDEIDAREKPLAEACYSGPGRA